MRERGKRPHGVRQVAETVTEDAAAERQVTITLWAGGLSPETVCAGGYEIQRRDLRRLHVLPEQRSYQERPLFSKLTPEQIADFQRLGPTLGRTLCAITAGAGGRAALCGRTAALAEVAEMFGCPARRWREVRWQEDDRAPGPERTATVTEAWYLDADAVAARCRGFCEALVQRGLSFVGGGTAGRCLSGGGETPRGSEVGSQEQRCFPRTAACDAG